MNIILLGKAQTHFGTRVYGGNYWRKVFMAAANLTAKSLYSLHAYFSILAMPPHLFCITQNLYVTAQVLAPYKSPPYSLDVKFIKPCCHICSLKMDWSTRPLRLNILQQNNYRQNSAIKTTARTAYFLHNSVSEFMQAFAIESRPDYPKQSISAPKWKMVLYIK